MNIHIKSRTISEIGTAVDRWNKCTCCEVGGVAVTFLIRSFIRP
jgi:hypothetical protein